MQLWDTVENKDILLKNTLLIKVSRTEDSTFKEFLIVFIFK